MSSATTPWARSIGATMNASLLGAVSAEKNLVAHRWLGRLYRIDSAIRRACAVLAAITASEWSGWSRKCSNTASTVRVTSAVVDSTPSSPIPGLPGSVRYSAVSPTWEPLAVLVAWQHGQGRHRRVADQACGSNTD